MPTLIALNPPASTRVVSRSVSGWLNARRKVKGRTVAKSKNTPARRVPGSARFLGLGPGNVPAAAASTGAFILTNWATSLTGQYVGFFANGWGKVLGKVVWAGLFSVVTAKVSRRHLSAVVGGGLTSAGVELVKAVASATGHPMSWLSGSGSSLGELPNPSYGSYTLGCNEAMNRSKMALSGLINSNALYAARGMGQLANSADIFNAVAG